MLRQCWATHPECVVNIVNIIAGFVFPQLSVCDWPQCGEISISYFLFLLDHIRPHNPLQIPPSLQDPACPAHLRCTASCKMWYGMLELYILNHFHLCTHWPQTWIIQMNLHRKGIHWYDVSVARLVSGPVSPDCQGWVMDDPPWPGLAVDTWAGEAKTARGQFYKSGYCFLYGPVSRWSMIYVVLL